MSTVDSMNCVNPVTASKGTVAHLDRIGPTREAVIILVELVRVASVSLTKGVLQIIAITIIAALWVRVGHRSDANHYPSSSHCSCR